MVSYGHNKDYHVVVENVDFHPELAGIKIANLPVIVSFSLMPLWFDQLLISLTLLVSLVAFFYHAARREDEGRPIVLNAYFICIISKIPRQTRQLLLPSVAAIKPHLSLLRR